MPAAPSNPVVGSKLGLDRPGGALDTVLMVVHEGILPSVSITTLPPVRSPRLQLAARLSDAQVLVARGQGPGGTLSRTAIYAP